MPDDPDLIDLGMVVNGNRYEGWKQVSVRSSIEDLSPTFSVTCASKWSEDGADIPIEDQDFVQIFMGEKKVLSGWVEDVNESYDSRSHEISVSGRSRTGDLVDCPARYKTGRIANKTMKQIAELLCEPFGITVSLGFPDLDIDDIIPAFKIQEGESVFEALNELGRKEGILLHSDADGNLVLTRAAKTPLKNVQIRTGENIKRGGLSSNSRERFSQYIFKGQSPGTDHWNGKAAAQLRNDVKDEGVTRYRPLLVVEHHAALKRLERRAIWERNTRAGRGHRFSYAVRGWSNLVGIWSPNTVVRLVDTMLGYDDDMLITEVNLIRNREDGKIADLQLVVPATYDVLKNPKPPKRGRKGKFGKILAALKS